MFAIYGGRAEMILQFLFYKLKPMQMLCKLLRNCALAWPYEKVEEIYNSHKTLNLFSKLRSKVHKWQPTH